MSPLIGFNLPGGQREFPAERERAIVQFFAYPPCQNYVTFDNGPMASSSIACKKNVEVFR